MLRRWAAALIACAAALAPAARAEDVPGLTDADRALLALCGRAGADRVDGRPLVRYWNGSRRDVTPGHPVATTYLGFLVREDADSFLAVGLGLRGWPNRKTPPGVPDHARVTYERADLVTFVEAALADRAAGVRPTYGDPTEPPTPTTLLAGATWELLVLARACVQARREDLAKRLVDWARAEAPDAVARTWPPRERRATVEPPENAALVTLLADDRWDAFLESFPDPGLSYTDLAAAAEKWKANFPGIEFAEADETLATLRTMRTEEEERRRRPAPAAPPSETARIDDLVFRLREVRCMYDDFGATLHAGYRPPPPDGKAPEDADEQLIRIGLPAVPRLIEHLDDARFTHSVSIWYGGSRQVGGPDPVLRIGDLAWHVLVEISGESVLEGKKDPPPPVGTPKRAALVAAARRWFETTRGRTQAQVLAETVDRGGEGATTAAGRLAEVDPAAAVLSIGRRLRAGRAVHHHEENLVRILDRIDSPAARDAVLSLLRPEVPRRVRAAAATLLARRGRAEGLDVAVELFARVKESEQAEGMAPDRPEALLEGVLDGASPRAIEAVSRVLPAYSVDVRLAAPMHVRGARSDLRSDGEKAKAPKPTAASEAAVDELLGSLLEDVTVRMGMTLRYSDGAIEDPVVGEMAALALARRHPDRWSFDERAVPAARKRARVRIANDRRALAGKPPLPAPTRPPRPVPVPPAEVRAAIERAASAPTEADRAAARAEIESRGLAVAEALGKELASTPKTEPGYEGLDALLRRISLTVSLVTVAPGSVAPGDAFGSVLAGLRGRRFEGRLWERVVDAFLDAPPAGAHTLLLFAERERADEGVGLRVVLLPESAFVGEGWGWSGSGRSIPRIRRGDVSTYSGIDAALEGVRAEETFSVSGDARIEK